MAKAKKRQSAAAKKPVITGSMPVQEIIQLLPHAGPLLAQYGLHCFGCTYSDRETLAEGCQNHGFTDADVEQLVVELNELMEKTPDRPEHLTVTKPAAEALSHILKSEGKEQAVLSVQLDAGGNFCMEFQDRPAIDEKIFGHAEVPSVRVTATAMTLARIGGATIDFREGRFKLDMPAVLGACACEGGSCACGKAC